MTKDEEHGKTQLGRLIGKAKLGEQRPELTLAETGPWLVLSATSAHFFDLDAGLVSRVPGDGAPDFVTDEGRRLRTLDTCRVGECGEWTMEPLPGEQLVDFAWHISTPVVLIARVEGLERLAADPD